MKKLLKAKVKEVKAITLIALVVTIVILLIISTVAITLLVNNNLMGNAKYAVDKYNNSTNDENTKLANYYNEIENLQSNREELQYISVPTGTIISLMGKTAPVGYLACDGTEYNIENYANLAEYFKTQFESSNYFGGNGTTTFAVPNLQGEFLRGTGTNTTTGYEGEEVGTHENATKIMIAGKDTPGSLTMPEYGNFDQTTLDADKRETNSLGGRYTGAWSSTFKDARTDWYRVRPTNTSVLYCIKY